MNLKQIDDELPEGLHDAKILSIEHDFEAEIVRIRLKLFVSAPNIYRSGEITFTKVKFCAIEPPAAESSFLHPGSLCITSFEASSSSLPKELLDALPSDTPCYSLFNRDWLSEIHIAAANAEFKWLN